MIMMIVCRERRVLSFEVGGVARKSSQERTHTAKFASRRVVTCLISESTVESSAAEQVRFDVVFFLLRRLCD